MFQVLTPFCIRGLLFSVSEKFPEFLSINLLLFLCTSESCLTNYKTNKRKKKNQKLTLDGEDTTSGVRFFGFDVKLLTNRFPIIFCPNV